MLPLLASSRPGLRLELFAQGRRDIARLAEWLAQHPVLHDRAEVRHLGELRRSKADVYWYPWNVSIPAPRTGAVVVTMHDVAPVARPDPRWLSWRKNLRWRLRFAATARRAAGSPRRWRSWRLHPRSVAGP